MSGGPACRVACRIQQPHARSRLAAGDRDVESPAVPVKLGSSALSALVRPGESVVIMGDAGGRGRPMHATIVLDDCPAEAGGSTRQACHGRESRPVISLGDSGGPLLIGDREGGARLKGVASTGATIGETGWARWTRIEHVSEWILSVLLLQGTDGRSDSPSCAMPPASGDAAPTGGRIFIQERIFLCAPLGDTGEGVLLEYRMPPSNPNFILGEEWLLPGASDIAYSFHVRDSSGTIWSLNGFGGYDADPCTYGDSICNAVVRTDQLEIGISLDLSRNSELACDP